MSDPTRYEQDPFPSAPPPPLREPTVLDQVRRQYVENDDLAREIEDRVRRRLSPPPSRRT